MEAIYVKNQIYGNNPLIEALPPMMAGTKLIEALSGKPPYSDEIREKDAAERLEHLASLYEFYQPLPMTLDLYCQVYTALQHSYGEYSLKKEAQFAQACYAARKSGVNIASMRGGNSFSLVGVSGLGKSTALKHVLSLFPQVIRHERYNGELFFCNQIPYIVVQTPHDASIKALILDIYRQIDTLVGGDYQKEALKKRLSSDVLIGHLSRIVRLNHIGLLVVDELQNVTYKRDGGGMRLLNFLVQLINSADISVCMVGTPRVMEILQQEFRSARRAIGIVCDRLPNGSDFKLILNGLWQFQYTKYRAELTPEIANYLYRRSQGIPDILVKMFYHAQKQAILGGSEKLTIDLFEKTFNTNLGMVADFMSKLEESSTRYAQPQAAPAIPAMPPKTKPQKAEITGTDLRQLCKAFKKSNKKIEQVFSEYIKEVVAI